MIEVANRSVESWGPLAAYSDKQFNALVNQLNAKDAIKKHIKTQKKLKTYKVTFQKRWNSDTFEILAENEYDVSSKAREYFKEHGDKIGFKEQERSRWADGYAGYDSVSYVKVRS